MASPRRLPQFQAPHPLSLAVTGGAICAIVDGMKILVIGSGGREHAIVWRLAQDGAGHALFCAPGNAGIEALATTVPIGAEDVEGLTAWVRGNRPDLVVVGPEAPLCAGLADAIAALGVPVFGPCQAAARLEGSKAFSKEIMMAAGVPTARAEIFTDVTRAIAALERFDLPVVVKADGLAAGKGVIIAQTRAEAEEALRGMLEAGRFGAAGAEVLIEEFLEGEEASVFALCDGEHVALLPAAQDHKRVNDHDEGPNTGGMGAYTPAPIATPEVMAQVRDRVVLPTLRALRERGIVYRGVLFCGLMIGPKGVNVLEFNCRFGDPETEVVLPMLKGNFAALLLACAQGRLDASAVGTESGAAVTVVMAAPGYPGAYPKGLEISGVAEAEAIGCVVFHAGTAMREGKLVTAGGRVLTVTARGTNLREAVDNAYAGVAKIHFEGAHFRRDIAAKAFRHLH